MPDKVFVDTNLWIYLFLKADDVADQEKKAVVKQLLRDYPDMVISNQVLNEIANVFTRKYQIASNQIEQYFHELLKIVELVLIDERNTYDALHLVTRYKLSFFDALIVSAAKDAQCRVLFSEDLQDGQTLDGTLTIRNPFKTYHENAYKAGARCDKNASEQADGETEL